MDSRIPNATPGPDKGLPPVLPPSGRFLAQLFAVPSLIVLVVVLGLLGVFYWTKSGRSPAYFLEQLDSSNADIRWRGAADLAQILKRPEAESLRWKADPHFALDLTVRLRSALDELARAEAETLKQSEGLAGRERDALWRRLAAQRHHVSYLAAALGDFHVPVGLPLLAEIALRTNSPDAKGNTLQRRKAVWALANLGANTAKFKELPPEKRAEILDILKTEAGSQDTPRAAAARTALYYLDRDALSAKSLGAVTKADEVLAQAADAEDRYLREQVTLALNFWDGPLVEPTLLRLARDDGHGTLERITEDD